MFSPEVLSVLSLQGIPADPKRKKAKSERQKNEWCCQWEEEKRRAQTLTGGPGFPTGPRKPRKPCSPCTQVEKQRWLTEEVAKVFTQLKWKYRHLCKGKMLIKLSVLIQLCCWNKSRGCNFWILHGKSKRFISPLIKTIFIWRKLKSSN